MSDATTHLLLPYILAAQAQKHVTHNEALRLLDAMVGRFEYLTFAVDTQKSADGTVLPGIGGALYQGSGCRTPWRRTNSCRV